MRWRWGRNHHEPVAAASHAAPPLPIGQIQGTGAVSAKLGREVTVEGVVTADFSAGLGGWFIQDTGDGDRASSDALFVLGGKRRPPAPAVGSRVRVTGEVVEHGRDEGRTLTALRPAEVVVLGQGRPPEPVAISEPPQDWEALEGMLLRIDAPLTINGQHDMLPRGVLVASFDGRQYVPTERALPGEPAREYAAANARRRLLLDDASAAVCNGGCLPAWYLPAEVPFPRSGSVVVGARGIVDQRWGEYRLQLTQPLALRPAPRPPVPDVPGDVRLAVFNVENLFNGDGLGGGFPTARGARSAAEFDLQLARLVATLTALKADVIALMELEHDGEGPDSSIAQLTRALNLAEGAAGDWRFVETGYGSGRVSNTIRVGLLYRASRVQALGAPAVLRGGPFVRHSRPPLAQAFRAGDGPGFVVVANHLKSKSCREAKDDERDQGDGQGCWNETRVESAARLRDWLGTDPTGNGGELVAIVGDFNAYSREDPLRVLHQAGWLDAFALTGGVDAEAPYSYVYDAQSGRLDHALVNPALARRVAGAAIWHSNADEPAALGWRGQHAGDSRGPWRSSDHDPLLIGLWLRTADK